LKQVAGALHLKHSSGRGIFCCEGNVFGLSG